MNDSPISNFGSFDVVGVRKDGGLDLVISCSGGLDCSPQTIRALEEKVRNYAIEVTQARNPSLRERFGRSVDARIRIVISCRYAVHPDALHAIERLAAEVRSQEIDLILER